MNEKKIIAISELEFARLVKKAIFETLLANPETPENIECSEDLLGDFTGEILGKIHKNLFSTQYVIGTKGKCRRSGDNAIGGKLKNTITVYHKTGDLSRRNKK